jgi:NADH-quinone oxidoreductase subunit J
MTEVILFVVLATIAVGAAINLVVQTHPISSALSLIGVMAALAGLYLQLGGEFIAAAQLVVYAGAIMVLFVFVIMLLNEGAERPSPGFSIGRLLGVLLLSAFLGLLSFLIQKMLPQTEMVRFGAFTGGTPHDVGMKLFQDYLLPFEVTSILILIALLGAMVLARKEID